MFAEPNDLHFGTLSAFWLTHRPDPLKMANTLRKHLFSGAQAPPAELLRAGRARHRRKRLSLSAGGDRLVNCEVT
jgi:hypothetical protein